MIEVRDLVFSYGRAAEPVVRGLSFEVARGEIFGFLGPSGAGKSTTQKILIGLLKEYSGSASVLATEVSGWRGDQPGRRTPPVTASRCSAQKTPACLRPASRRIAKSSTRVSG